MLRLIRKSLAICALLLVGAAANATTVTYNPVPADIYDLDHYQYYTWGITDNTLAAALATGEYEITDARLTFNNIYNWTSETDHLWTHLLDNPKTGVRTFTDDQGGGDAFTNATILSNLGVTGNPLVGHYSDPDDDASAETLVYNLATLGLIDELTAYILSAPTSSNRAHFGFGFDPDCHYFNTGISFELTYDLIPDDEPVVPEPATLSLLGLGLSGIGILRRKRAKLAA